MLTIFKLIAQYLDFPMSLQIKDKAVKLCYNFSQFFNILWSYKMELI